MGADANQERTPRVLLATAEGSWDTDEDAEELTSALDARDIPNAPAVWTDPRIRWDDAELVVVRSTWDYAPRRDEFVSWAHRVQRGTRLANPAAVIQWNTDKAYLGELAGAGFPAVPTEFVEPGRVDLLPSVLRTVAEAGEFVVKPSVSAGSKDTGRFRPDEMDRALRLADAISTGGRTVMVQPYLASVDSDGETGLVYFDGEFSHAFNKARMLAPGADPEPGLYAPERINPSDTEGVQHRLAEGLLEFVEGTLGDSLRGSPLLYARVDLVADDSGRPVLMELELTEPSWFLATDPASPGRAAAAIAARLGH